MMGAVLSSLLIRAVPDWEWQNTAALVRREVREAKLDTVFADPGGEELLQAQKMQAVGLLAGGIAHDFNNLLTVITGRGELLRRRLPTGDRREISLILETAERAAALTRQLLVFSRKQVLESRVLDLNAVVRLGYRRPTGSSRSTTAGSPSRARSPRGRRSGSIFRGSKPRSKRCRRPRRPRLLSGDPRPFSSSKTGRPCGRSPARSCVNRANTVLEVADGHAAIELTSRHAGPIHLVLTDGLLGDLRDARPDLVDRRRPAHEALHTALAGTPGAREILDRAPAPDHGGK